MGGHHNLVEFHLDTLTTDNLDTVGHARQCVKGFLFYLKVQLGGKTDATHHAQRIIAESNLRIQRSGDDTVFQIGNAVEGVYQLAKALLVQTDGHGIDGKVATVLVIFQGTVFHYRLS